MKQRAKTGKHNGKLPLGYRSVNDPSSPSERSKVIILESEAVIVKKIYQLYASGKGLKALQMN